jgi:hypothetical protein
MSVLDEQVTQIRSTTGVIQSATLLIDAFAARLQAAVDTAIANGATEAQLAPVKAELTTMVAARDDLARAVAANPSTTPEVPAPIPVVVVPTDPANPSQPLDPQALRARRA